MESAAASHDESAEGIDAWQAAEPTHIPTFSPLIVPQIAQKALDHTAKTLNPWLLLDKRAQKETLIQILELGENKHKPHDF